MQWGAVKCHQSKKNLTLSCLPTSPDSFWAEAAKNAWSRPLAPAYEVPLESPWRLLPCCILLFLKKFENAWFDAYFAFSKFCSKWGTQAPLWCRPLLRAYEAPMESSWCVAYCSIFYFFQKLKIGGAVPFLIEKWCRCTIFCADACLALLWRAFSKVVYTNIYTFIFYKFLPRNNTPRFQRYY